MHLAIVTPVFNDWLALLHLIDELEAIDVPETFSLFVIDDGSHEPAVIAPLQKLHRIRAIEIISLTCNLGHQRAIAIGLVEMCKRSEAIDAVLVMDADGEDRPADIPRLLALAVQHPDYIACARRAHRRGLRIWYACYKAVFRLLTGARIDFGNFCLIPRSKLEALASNPSIWNHLAATLTRARIPLVRIPIDRGERYVGKSKMNFVTLVMHGLSAMAVYSDIVMVRLMLVTLALSALTGGGILAVVAVKFLTDLAIPGWASSVAGLLTVILLQAAMLFTIAAFSVLNTRNIRLVMPRLDAEAFVSGRRKIWGNDARFGEMLGDGRLRG